MPITDIPEAGPLHNPPAPNAPRSQPVRAESTSAKDDRQSSSYPLALALGVGVAALLVGLVAGRLSAPSETPAPVVATVPTGPVQTVYVPAPRSDAPSEADRVAFEKTSEAFLRAWVTPGPIAQRRAALAPLMTSEALAAVLVKDQANLPTGDVVGPPVQARIAGDGGLYLAKLSDGSRVEVLAERDSSGAWKVDEVQG